MNVCAGWANTGIKLMTYAANTRPTRKYELFSAWPSERSWQIRERNKFSLAIVTIGLRLNLPNIELDKDGVNVYLGRKKKDINDINNFYVSRYVYRYND